MISRTDSIGDVILTLPVAAVLKASYPGIKIAFLGRAYTRPVIDSCSNIDSFIDVEAFLAGEVPSVQGEKIQAILHVFPVAAIARKAKRLKIPLRIGTTNRLYHWLTCNRLVRLGRKHSPLHEAQLNLKLLAPLGITRDFSTAEIGLLFGMQRLEPLEKKFSALLDQNRYNLILHPKSQGSAREWGMENFLELALSLDQERYCIFISGTERESGMLQPLLEKAGGLVKDISGKMTLGQFLSFIAACQGLVANSTGPLHMAAALGKDAVGIYPPIRPVHPGRWAPLGPGAQIFVADKRCSDCKKDAGACHCMQDIKPGAVKRLLDELVKKYKA